MRTTVDRLVDGVVQTLLDAVLPDLATPYARGQLYAAVDVLRNLRDRVAPRADLADEESASATAALERTLAVLADAPAAAAAIRAALDGVPSDPPLARTAAVRAALVAALTAVDDLPADVARAARAPILEHLGGQTMRDVAVLKPSLLAEISQS
jgi:hypothetical protein